MTSKEKWEKIEGLERHLEELYEMSRQGQIQYGPFCLYTYIQDQERYLQKLYNEPVDDEEEQS